MVDAGDDQPRLRGGVTEKSRTHAVDRRPRAGVVIDLTNVRHPLQSDRPVISGQAGRSAAVLGRSDHDGRNPGRRDGTSRGVEPLCGDPVVVGEDDLDLARQGRNYLLHPMCTSVRLGPAS